MYTVQNTLEDTSQISDFTTQMICLQSKKGTTYYHQYLPINFAPQKYSTNGIWVHASLHMKNWQQILLFPWLGIFSLRKFATKKKQAKQKEMNTKTPPILTNHIHTHTQPLSKIIRFDNHQNIVVKHDLLIVNCFTKQTNKITENIVKKPQFDWQQFQVSCKAYFLNTQRQQFSLFSIFENKFYHTTLQNEIYFKKKVETSQTIKAGGIPQKNLNKTKSQISHLQTVSRSF